MARMPGLVTMAVRFTTATADRGDRAGAKIAQLRDVGEDPGSLAFQIREGIGHAGLHILTYIYVRITTTKKEATQTITFLSHTP